MKKIKIEIGDWSNDGHGQSEIVTLLSNRTIQELEVLYKKSCELTGLQFTTNGDESGRNRDWQEMNKWKVLQDYEQSTITDFQIEEFAKYGIVIEDPEFEGDVERFTELFLQFLKLSDSDFKWEILEGTEEEVLQLYIGYGIFGE
jgi:hypothetical protein